jgi:DNA primase
MIAFARVTAFSNTGIISQMTATRIPQSFIRDLIDRTDIADIVRPRIALKKKGQNYHACCPFHEEKTPSFTVSEKKQFYYCFGCGAHGNALDFLMQYDRMEFRDAIEYLATQHGLDVPTVAGYTPDRSYDALFTTLKHATQFYRQQLKHHPKAIEYLKSRGLSGEIAKTFGIGYAPPGWDNLLKSQGKDAKSRSNLASTGMVIDKDRDRCYDRFRQRIMFPIHDLRGRVIAFGGRALGDEQPKYLNSPETDIFHKSQTLYGLYQARQASNKLDKLLIVEGYMDVVSLYQQGITYAAATLGTAINIKHLQLCLRFTNEIIFCFDGDNAGRRAAWKALTIAMPTLRDGIQLKFLFLPEGEDPDSLVQKIGQNAFESKCNQAESLQQVFFTELKKQHPGDDPANKAAMAKSALSYIKQMPQGLYQELLSDELAKQLSVTREELAKTQTQHRSESHHSPTTSEATTPLSPLTMHCLTLLLQQPSLAKQVSYLHYLDESTHPMDQLLIKLIHIFKEHPELPIGQLLTHWQEPKGQALIAQLAAKDLPFPIDTYAKEFSDTMNMIEQQQRQAKINKLIKQSKHTPLTEEQKQILNQLIKIKN